MVRPKGVWNLMPPSKPGAGSSSRTTSVLSIQYPRSLLSLMPVPVRVPKNAVWLASFNAGSLEKDSGCGVGCGVGFACDEGVAEPDALVVGEVDAGAGEYAEEC